MRALQITTLVAMNFAWITIFSNFLQIFVTNNQDTILLTEEQRIVLYITARASFGILALFMAFLTVASIIVKLKEIREDAERFKRH